MARNDREWLGSALWAIYAGDSDAFGLRPRPGQREIASIAAASYRNDKIIALARSLAPASVATLASQITAAWKRPSSAPGLSNEARRIARSLKDSAAKPLSERTIRGLIAGHEIPPIDGQADGASIGS